MSDAQHCDVDFGKQYRLPGVEPPRVPPSTFSAQRYDPLRVPPALPVGNGTTELVFHDVREMVLAEMPLELMSSLSFPPPRVILSPTFTRFDSGDSAGRRQKTWMHKLYNSYENGGKCVRFVWRGVTTYLLASGTAFHNVVRCVRDAIKQVIEPLAGVFRGVVPDRVTVTRIALH